MVMFTDDDSDRDYYYERAEAELILAQAATHPAVVTSHFALAENYLDLVYGKDTGKAEPASSDEASKADQGAL